MAADMSSSSTTCTELAALPCVFVVALGRTGSTHLLRVLNAIPGYRISGETDNAWIYLGWWHAAQQAKPGGIPPPPTDGNSADAAYLGRRLRVLHRQAASPLEDGRLPSVSPRTLCAMRELMLLLHNPSPRARVFGFKEIYSPFVRDPTATGEVMTQGVGFVRTLFPRARFVFHARRNLTRAANSDFWMRDWRDASGAPVPTPPRDVRIEHISSVVARYRAYARAHPDHAYVTTLEGLTDGADATGELAGLFRFLGEPLTTPLQGVARSRLPLRDWVETCGEGFYTGRVNGTTVCIEKTWERRQIRRREAALARARARAKLHARHKLGKSINN